jgi:hypothetical protein
VHHTVTTEFELRSCPIQRAAKIRAATLWRCAQPAFTGQSLIRATEPITAALAALWLLDSVPEA